jgi:hypothetical protein
MSNFERGRNLNEAFQYVSDDLLDIAEQEKAAQKSRRKRAAWVRYAAAAACICLVIALPVSAAANNWFGIRDLWLSNSNDDDALISLAGYQGSPEAEALREWNDFLKNYDTGHEILNALGNGVFVAEGREDWSMYGVYSYEMGEKLDEIAEKYGLKLHSEVNFVDYEELIYCVGSFMDASGGGYIYEDGSFQFEGDAELADFGTVDFQLMRRVKGTFDETYLNVGQLEDYEEWQYVTSGGEPVLLEIGSQQTSLIFTEGEECFIAINVLAGLEDGLTKSGLQELADKIDFTVLKNVQTPDMCGDVFMQEDGENSDSISSGSLSAAGDEAIKESSALTIDDITITIMDRSLKNDAGEVLIELTYDLVQLPETFETYRSINQQLLQDYQSSSVNDDYSDYLNDPYLDPSWPYGNSTSAEVSCLTDDYICITYSWYWYMGGAMNYGTSGRLYDLNTGKRATLDQVLDVDADKLLSFLKDKIRYYITENDIFVFDEAYDTIQGYTLDDLSFTFTDNELVICIPQYELVPGVTGPMNIETGLYLNRENDLSSIS